MGLVYEQKTSILRSNHNVLAAENDRLSNSEFMGRAMDDMLPEEMVRGQYVEVSVYPGYDNHGERTLPQIYMIDDNTVVLYCM